MDDDEGDDGTLKSFARATAMCTHLDLSATATANMSMHTQVWMHDKIFHFEISKNFTEILKYFKTPSLKYFMKFLIFIIK